MRIFGKTITWSTILAFIVTGIALGFLAKIGENIYDSLKSTDFSHLSEFVQGIVNFFMRTVEVRVITLLLISIAVVPFYRLIKFGVSRLFSEVIFREDFSSNTYFWALNYWGRNNPTRTNRVENGHMIFEALPADWSSNLTPGESGAYYDVRTGIVKGLNYSVECRVKSSPSTTMRFQLWLHDAVDRNSVRGDLETPPSNDYKTYRLNFKATDSLAIRIHLHCFAGQGQIIIDEVKVIRK